MWCFAELRWAGMMPMTYASTYLVVLLGRSFYYALFYWLVVAAVTARQLSEEAQRAAAEAALLENEAMAADLETARIQFDPRGLAASLTDAAKLVESDPKAAEARILGTAAELQKALAASSPATRRAAA
jgi:hypothetical protein